MTQTPLNVPDIARAHCGRPTINTLKPIQGVKRGTLRYRGKPDAD